MKKSDLLNKIKDAGVIGAGGAGFPTHAKLNCSPEYVIVNCAECELLIRSGKHLMERNAKEIVMGLEVAMLATGAGKGVLAVKYKNKAAVAALENAVSGKANISIKLLDDYYPAGDEQQIIYEVTGRVIPAGQLPIAVGCVVMNCQTAYQVGQAAKDIPVTGRMVTVNGAVRNPFTSEIPIGTPVPYLIELAGGPSIPDYVVVIGGPLMGRVAENPGNEFVTKTTNGILILPKDNKVVGFKTEDMDHQLRIARAVCCQCNYCTLVCPRNNLGLEVQPNKIMQALTLSNADVLTDGQAALACCNCGLCTYIGCNMGLTPSRFVTMVRQELLAKRIKATKEPGKVNPFRSELKMPTHRLVQRLGLEQYDVETPFLKDIADPGAVRISLKQHIGAPCEPIVAAGDRVEAGQMIGKVPEKALGAAIHASIGGTVSAVGSDYIDIRKA